MVDLKPGQLWSWNFSVGNGWWMLNVVSAIPRAITITKGAVFTVIALNDVGPPVIPTFGGFDVTDAIDVTLNIPKRWHVVLVGDVMVWFEHEYFKESVLLRDVV